ncbi:unnamed protein product [Ectocarpus sp. 12 AP-2014]
MLSSSHLQCRPPSRGGRQPIRQCRCRLLRLRDGSLVLFLTPRSRRRRASWSCRRPCRHAPVETRPPSSSARAFGPSGDFLVCRGPGGHPSRKPGPPSFRALVGPRFELLSRRRVPSLLVLRSPGRGPAGEACSTAAGRRRRR